MIGDRIRALRDKRNLTRDEVALSTGITYHALSKYETNDREPDYDTLQKIADYFNVSTDYLLGRVDHPQGLYVEAHNGNKAIFIPKIEINEENSPKQLAHFVETVQGALNAGEITQETADEFIDNMRRQFDLLLKKK